MSFIRVSKSACYLKSTSGSSSGDFCGVVIHVGTLRIPLVLRNCVFNEVCKWHDVEYNKLNWSDKNTNSIALDKEMLRRFLVIASDSKKLILQAYLMYTFARTWGMMRWSVSRFGIIW